MYKITWNATNTSPTVHSQLFPYLGCSFPSVCRKDTWVTPGCWVPEVCSARFEDMRVVWRARKVGPFARSDVAQGLEESFVNVCESRDPFDVGMGKSANAQ